jgi:hypothetical protein
LTSKKRDRAVALAEMGLTPPDFALFNAVHYGSTPSPDSLPAIAAREDYNPDGSVATEGECQIALAACLAKGWVQVIDETALAKIAHELREGRFVGPIYGLPEIGGVDFTRAGADLWRRLCCHCFPDWRSPDFTDVVHSKTTHYFRTKAAALAAIPKSDRAYAVTVIGPTAIGPWRVQWWRRFPDGYRVDIEERMQWQGRAGGGGSHCVMSRPGRQADPLRLRHVLDCHNVTLAEWLLLAAMESAWHRSAFDLPRRAAGPAADLFGVTASEEECRTGLEACLRYRWLRVVDQHAIDEVQALLRDDPVFLPMPRELESREGEIDFSPSGAVLYRMIAAEWLGADWENTLNVWNDYYREEHRYCEAEDVLQGLVQEYAASGEVVRASKIVPIGPWCVYWWERFSAGYRLELKIGNP